MTGRLDEFIKVILWACIEDYAGLWELCWEVNSSFSELPEEERKQLLLKSIRFLLDNRFIKLYRCNEPYGDLFELSLEDASFMLHDSKNWEAPDVNAVSIRAGATKKGEELYEKI